MREKLPSTIVLPMSTTPPTLPPIFVNPATERGMIIDIAKSFARELCAAGKHVEGYDERLVKMEESIFRVIARSLVVYTGAANHELLEICEHGCHLHVNYGFVIMAGCPEHD